MDERRTQLLVAAQALRGWVHVQQAARHGVAPAHLTPLRAPTSIPAGTRSLFTPIGDEPDTVHSTEQDVVAPAPMRVRVDVGAGLKALARFLAALWSRAWPMAARVWKPAFASLAVIALIGTARSSWPQWSGVVKAQLRAAGQHVSVFDRPRPAPQAPSPKPNPTERVAPVRRTGRLQIESNPSGAHVIIDGRERGLTPLTLNDVVVGTHTVALKSEAGFVQHPVVVSHGRTTQVNEAIYSGWLHVSSSLDLQLFEEGHGLRLDESNQLLLPPGVHELRFENRRVGFSAARTVEVRPGETTSISVEPPASKLSITASTPAEVLVDGVLVGGTPLTEIAIAVGTREIVVRNAAGVERRQTMTVTVEPVTLAIDFGAR
ncbi:MAG: PEGA domain-containing protein [Vicinamibacterales bacterium]